MAALLLDGKSLAQKVSTSLALRVKRTVQAGLRPPGLSVIMVGDNPASQAYVRNKEKMALECGFRAETIKLPADCSEAQLQDTISKLNSSADVDGILLQLPLPKHLSGDEFVAQIDPKKDADGLHSVNQGYALQGRPGVRSCTPLGSMMLIDLALSGPAIGQPTADSFGGLPKRADLSSKRAVVVGRSNLVGKPLALLLLERNATVTVAHSKSGDLAGVCRTADILVAAVGVPGLVQDSWVKPGAIVIDVGINRLPSGKLGGDVNFETVSKVASAITPVPGGVGPMTVAMLMSNTFDLYQSRNPPGVL